MKDFWNRTSQGTDHRPTICHSIILGAENSKQWIVVSVARSCLLRVHRVSRSAEKLIMPVLLFLFKFKIISQANQSTANRWDFKSYANS